MDPKFSLPRSVEDYKQFFLYFDTYIIHPVDQMEFHNQFGEMLYNTITNRVVATTKLKVLVSNIQAQLNLERVSSEAKHTKIKSLEDLVIKLKYDPNDTKVAEEIIRNKNADIAVLKK